MLFNLLFSNQASRKLEDKSNAKEVERTRLQSKLKVMVNGLIVIDNVPWHGKVPDPLVTKFFLLVGCDDADVVGYSTSADAVSSGICVYFATIMNRD
ncbi:hypothetical protein RIF29_25528 [Crotalaria pallida]|uniref:Uncharacterized protein n=1 Tax=Crotalaria pallida TaxID=3830 RepID=A0AAN9HXK4_CROPI